MRNSGTFANPERTEKIDCQRAVYTYDGAGRLGSRSVPGGGTTEYRYDRYDRLAFHRDGALAAKNKWIFHLYDAQGRCTRISVGARYIAAAAAWPCRKFCPRKLPLVAADAMYRVRTIEP